MEAVIYSNGNQECERAKICLLYTSDAADDA